MRRRSTKFEDALREASPNQAVMYARVSSKEQEREGYSIPAQERLLRAYALEHGLEIVREFDDVETAKDTGRTKFAEMLAFLKRTPGCRIVLVEKTDRLYRNLKDWVEVDEIDVEIHLVKEGVVLAQNSKSAEKFMHGIRVLMAKNYIDNLSEEVRKGQREKAETGSWPSQAPLGYINVVTPEGKRTIVPDPERSALVRGLFETYSAGGHSILDLTRHARELGLTFRKSGHPVNSATVHHVLRTRTYCGEFLWKGRVYPGSYEPIVSKQLWQQVQDLLEERCSTKPKRRAQDFVYSGVMHCGACGCQLTGEMKKKQQRYIYYHCTGRRGRHPAPYLREDRLNEAFGAEFDRLALPKELHDWLVLGLKASHKDERQLHEQSISRLQAEYNMLQKRLDAMYEDKLDGRVATAYFDRRSAEWRAEQHRILDDVKNHQQANRHYVDSAVEMLEMARVAARSYATADTARKQELIHNVVASATWTDAGLDLTFRKPFHLLSAATTDRAALMRTEPGWTPNGGQVPRHGVRKRVRTDPNSQGSNSSDDSDSNSKIVALRPDGARNEIWLGGKDSNLRSPDPKSGALPLGYRPMRGPV